MPPIDTPRFSPTVRTVNSELAAGATPQQMLERLQELARSGNVPLHDIRSTAQEVRASTTLSPEQKQQLGEALNVMREIVQQTNDPEARDSMEWLASMDPFAHVKDDLGLA